MIKFLPSSPNTNQNNLQLTSVAEKIKAAFRPGNIVRAKVAKTDGDRVILNLNNNLFQVKSEVPLSEGTWIKGRVHVDNSGTTYLQLLESQEEAELNSKAGKFFQEQGSRIADTTLNRELAKSVLAMGKKPTPQLISELSSFFNSEGTGVEENLQPRELAFLYLNGLPITDTTISATRGLIQADLSQELSSSPLGDLFLIPELPEQGLGANQTQEPIQVSISNLFKMFLGTGAKPTIEQSAASPLIPSDGTGAKTDNLLDLLGLSRAVNAVNNQSHQAEPLWGFFLFQTGQNKTPGQFFINRFQRQNRRPGYGNDKKPPEITLGINLNLQKLGPVVIRIHFMSKVLSLQLTANTETTKSTFEDHLVQLKQRLNNLGLTVARMETHQAYLEDPVMQRHLARIPFVPDGNLDYKI